MRADRSWDWYRHAKPGAEHLDDTTKDAETLAKKILSVRLFNDETNQQMWRRSVRDIDGEILCGKYLLQSRLTLVSQFTLHAVTAKGAKPDFHSTYSSASMFLQY